MHRVALSESQQAAQNELKNAQEEHAERFAQVRDDFDARIATLVRLNDANTSIAKHQFETEIEAAKEQSEERLAAIAEENDGRLLEVEKVWYTPCY